MHHFKVVRPVIQSHWVGCTGFVQQVSVSGWTFFCQDGGAEQAHSSCRLAVWARCWSAGAGGRSGQVLLSWFRAWPSQVLLHWCRGQASPGASLLVQGVGLAGAALLMEGLGHARCLPQYGEAGPMHCPPSLLAGLPRPTQQVHRVAMSYLCVGGRGLCVPAVEPCESNCGLEVLGKGHCSLLPYRILEFPKNGKLPSLK